MPRLPVASVLRAWRQLDARRQRRVECLRGRGAQASGRQREARANGVGVAAARVAQVSCERGAQRLVQRVVAQEVGAVQKRRHALRVPHLRVGLRVAHLRCRAAREDEDTEKGPFTADGNVARQRTSAALSSSARRRVVRQPACCCCAACAAVSSASVRWLTRPSSGGGESAASLAPDVARSARSVLQLRAKLADTAATLPSARQKRCCGAASPIDGARRRGLERWPPHGSARRR
jgi:hypothetical protein